MLESPTNPYLQAKLVLRAAEHAYAYVPPLNESLLVIVVSTSQGYRRTQDAAHALPAAALNTPCPLVSAGPVPLYGIVDGSMLFTDAGWWQEVKVGHVFQVMSAAVGPAGPSQYMAQRGPFAAFTQRFEQVRPPDAHARQVFITDGTQCINRCLQARYPHDTHFLNFYHIA